jgi:hypothetical protein
MKVFISWSGSRSQALAEALKDWLPMILQHVEPWLSKSDIEAGQRWSAELAKELEGSNFGIICATPENINSQWTLFEAGALAKFMQEGRVVPLLLDIEIKDISGPLAQFQAKKVDKVGFYDLVKSINKLSENKVLDGHLNSLFELVWPNLNDKIKAIPNSVATTKEKRPLEEILEELVATVRGLDARIGGKISPALLSQEHANRQYRPIYEEFLSLIEIITGLLQKRDEPGAIRFYQDATKCDVKQAVDFIEAVSNEAWADAVRIHIFAQRNEGRARNLMHAFQDLLKPK